MSEAFHKFCADVQSGKFGVRITKCPKCNKMTKDTNISGNIVGGRLGFYCQHCNKEVFA